MNDNKVLKKYHEQLNRKTFENKAEMMISLENIDCQNWLRKI